MQLQMNKKQVLSASILEYAELVQIGYSVHIIKVALQSSAARDPFYLVAQEALHIFTSSEPRPANKWQLPMRLFRILYRSFQVTPNLDIATDFIDFDQWIFPPRYVAHGLMLITLWRHDHMRKPLMTLCVSGLWILSVLPPCFLLSWYMIPCLFAWNWSWACHPNCSCLHFATKFFAGT